MAAAICNPSTDAMDTFLVAIGGFPDQVLKQADSLGGALIGSGMTLLTFSFLAATVTAGYRNLMGNGGVESVLTDVFRAMILGVIALALLNNWAAASQAIPAWFKSDVISKLTASTDPASAIGQFYAVFAEMFREMTAWIETGAKPCSESEGGMMASLQSLFDTITLKTFMDVIRLYVSLAIAILIIIIPLTAFSALLLGVLFGNALIMKIGIIFGPLAIAFIPYAPMAWLATSWLRFMITTGLTLAIAYLVTSILATAMLPVFQTMLKTGVNAQGIGLATIFMGASIALILVFGCILLLKVDDIAQGLVGGGGAGGGGAMAAAAMRSLKLKASPAGKASKSGGKQNDGSSKGGSASQTKTAAPTGAAISNRAGSTNQ
ncbi:MAG: hypothetical protein CVU36_00470 [Betaproteobacteria bacterium HGW-Betaproteobacteria-9]|jgi:hypothetical protein|nr:MAG: hypothetical protein CVU36_00470 [Betaproteobacteria bacterium HGW-Betaproteobacteria-9]